MPKRARSYEIGLSERLKDRDYALAYLSSAWEDSDEMFLLALRDVATAKGIATVAAVAGVNRENLYKGLSRQGNPTYSTLRSVLRALGVGLGPVTTPATNSPLPASAILESHEAPGSYIPITASRQPAWLAQKFLDQEASLYC